MKKFLYFLLVAYILAACSPSETYEPMPGALDVQEEVTIIPTSEILLQPGIAAWEQTAGSLTARIFSAPDTTVNKGTFVVQGQANEEVIVTINDTLFTNPAEAIFSVPVSLEEGPNVVEIIISDFSGNEASFTLTITYET